jgi:uncharacterized protein YndB with AHSA1/START domain
MTTSTETLTATQVYRVYIKATPQAIWDAITQPEWSQRYGFGGYVDYDLQPGGHYRARPSAEFRAKAAADGHDLPDVVIDGEVLEASAPHRLVQTFHMMMDEGTASEAPTRLTYDIKETGPGVCSLTLTHEFEGAPTTAQILSGAWEQHGAGGGWAWILSDLKTVLETGHGFNG